MTLSAGRPYHIPYAEISRKLVARDRPSGTGSPGATAAARIGYPIRSPGRFGGRDRPKNP